MAHGHLALRGFDHRYCTSRRHSWHHGKNRGFLWLASRYHQGDATTYDEVRAKTLLVASGLDIPEGGIARSRDQAIQLAGHRTVVMKAVSAELSHKTELGAVRLNISGQDMDSVKLMDSLRVISPDILVEEMIDDCVAELSSGES